MGEFKSLNEGQQTILGVHGIMRVILTYIYIMYIHLLARALNLGYHNQTNSMYKTVTHNRVGLSPTCNVNSNSLVHRVL